jgi:hypothetical protein
MLTLDWRNATPETINAYRMLTAVFPAAQTITPVFYGGLIAGSEFLTYNANKMYFCLNIRVGFSAVPGVGSGFLKFKNENDVYSMVISNNQAIYSLVPALNYNPLPIETKDLYFSRIEVAIYTYMFFNGYRLNT